MTEQYIEELISKYANGSATREEVETLMNWYRSSDIGDVQWMTQIPGEKHELHERMLLRLRNHVSPRKKIYRLALVRIAAMLVIISGIGIIIFLSRKSPGAEYETIQNPPGKIQLVTLPDSSRVWLNAATTLRYEKDFSKHRRIILDGEAYFEVTHDVNNPFHVQAGEIETIVLGTSFLVKSYARDTATAVDLITGSVKVMKGSSDLALLTPSQQLIFDKKRLSAQVTFFDTVSTAAWRQGKLLFDDQPLYEIANTLERWYGIKIRFNNPAMKECRYYMSFDNTLPLDMLLSRVNEITEAKFTLDKNMNIVTVTGDACK